MSLRIVFMGTPDFAVPSLKALAASKHTVVAAVTQPDRITGTRVSVPAVKKAALELGIPVLQYNKVSREGVEDIRALEPDVLVTCSFGQILSREMLTLAPMGVINAHGSILPKYRGASPIQSAVLNGEEYSGITIMRTAYEVDSGDVMFCDRVKLDEKETAESLFEKLSAMAATALCKAMDKLQDGTATFTPQDSSAATFCKTMTKESGRIDFSLTSTELDRFVRGMYSWPSAFTTVNGKLLKVFSVCPSDISAPDMPCGAVVECGAKTGLVVRVADGTLLLDEIQYEGAKRMDSRTFAIGHKIAVGTMLGE